eukprot:SAG22_NODE_18_length_32591_cov_38.043549_24_plen_197_part_00
MEATKPLSFCCASTVFRPKTAPFRAVPLDQDCADACADLETCIGYAYNGNHGSHSGDNAVLDDLNFRCILYGAGLADAGSLPGYEHPAAAGWEADPQPANALGRIEIGSASGAAGWVCKAGPAACSGRGECDVHRGTCTCGAPFYNHDCSLADCSPPCANGGTCDHLFGTCACATPFFGAACELGNATDYADAAGR